MSCPGTKSTLTGLQLPGPSFCPFFWMGVTFASCHSAGTSLKQPALGYFFLHSLPQAMSRRPCQGPAEMGEPRWEAAELGSLLEPLWPGLRSAELRFGAQSPTGESEPSLRQPRTAYQKSVWDAVSAYIRDHLQLRQGVHIPALGSFDVVTKCVKVRNETIIFPMPVFYLARNLIVSHNLTDNKEYLPGKRELEPLQFPEVAAAASVSWKTVESRIRGTTSLISRTLGKGENIALVLRDVGVLLIEGTKVQMKFYYEFLEMLAGKENLHKVMFYFPHDLGSLTRGQQQCLPLAHQDLSGWSSWPASWPDSQLLKPRPESFWSLMKEPQKKVLSAHSKKCPQPLPTICEAPMSLWPHPPKGRPGISRTERPWPH
ncbi:coiled-coil domain-containing protein 81-like [Anas acuta]|uniref:coiled-coil domain-containing protein 81-like n=1 Tax=Anas acuta TaxID=28680 RepID=UPI0035C89475